MMSKLASANTKAVMNARKNMMNTSNNVSVISAKKSEIMNTSQNLKKELEDDQPISDD